MPELIAANDNAPLEAAAARSIADRYGCDLEVAEQALDTLLEEWDRHVLYGKQDRGEWWNRASCGSLLGRRVMSGVS